MEFQVIADWMAGFVYKIARPARSRSVYSTEDSKTTTHGIIGNMAPRNSITPQDFNNNVVNSKELEACASAEAVSSRTDGPGEEVIEVQPEPATTSKKPRTGWRRYIGMIMAFSASMNFSFGVLFAKLLQDYGYTGNDNSFWRYTGVCIGAVPLLFYYEIGFIAKEKRRQQQVDSKSISATPSQISVISKESEAQPKQQAEKPVWQSTMNTVWPLTEPSKRKLAFFVFLRGFFAASAVVLRYYALDYLPIGDTSVISYSTPVLVTIMAHFFLKERAGIISFVIAFTTLVGVVIVSKPPVLTGSESFTSETLTGTAFAVASLTCASIQICLTRTVRTVHFAFLTVTIGFIGIAIASVLLLTMDANFEFPEEWPTESLYVLGLVCTSFLGQMSIILGLKFEQAGPVSLIRTSDCVIGFILQYAFMSVVPEWTSAVGGAIVIAGVLVTASRKYLQELPENAPARRRFRLLLI